MTLHGLYRDAVVVLAVDIVVDIQRLYHRETPRGRRRRIETFNGKAIAIGSERSLMRNADQNFTDRSSIGDVYVRDTTARTRWIDCLPHFSAFKLDVYVRVYLNLKKFRNFRLLDLSRLRQFFVYMTDCQYNVLIIKRIRYYADDSNVFHYNFHLCSTIQLFHMTTTIAILQIMMRST